VIGRRSNRLVVASQRVKIEFESCGEKNQVSFYKGVLSGAADALERVKARAGMVSVPKFPYAYTDRAGTIHLPFDQAVEIARRLYAPEPDTFLINAETTESKSSRDVRHGEDHLASLLNEHGASFALIRQWAARDAALAQGEAEIQRLERLVWDAIYVLQKGPCRFGPTRSLF
jgi:hypothetical protein